LIEIGNPKRPSEVWFILLFALNSANIDRFFWLINLLTFLVDIVQYTKNLDNFPFITMNHDTYFDNFEHVSSLLKQTKNNFNLVNFVSQYTKTLKKYLISSGLFTSPSDTTLCTHILMGITDCHHPLTYLYQWVY
jgi:hypothetical protein